MPEKSLPQICHHSLQGSRAHGLLLSAADPALSVRVQEKAHGVHRANAFVCLASVFCSRCVPIVQDARGWAQQRREGVSGVRL